MNVVDAARAYLGCPFEHQGRTRHGLDCAGLILLAYRDAGVLFEDIKGYGRNPHKDGLQQAVERQLHAVDDMQPGDVLLMRFIREPQHVALVTDLPDGRIGVIHAHSQVGRVVEHALDAKWRRRIVGVYRP